jgi:hypothetical protein
MKKGIVLLALVLGLPTGRLAAADDPAFADDMRFLNALRARGDHDLALALLERLSKKAPPQVASELALEAAKTRLGVAADEPDSTKRMAIYLQVRGELEAFLTRSPNHPRASEIQLDIARVALMVGRTQLSRAMMQDTPEGRTAEGDRARATLEDAGKKLQAVAKLLDAQIEALKDPKTVAEATDKKRLEEQRLHAELEIGVNIFDQARTYSATSRSTEVLKTRGQKVLEAAKVLEKVASGDVTSSLVWQAQAWLARCIDESGDPKKAREKLNIIIDDTTPAARDAQRLARYFRLLVYQEQKEKDYLNTIEESANRWIRDFPRYLKTPEGYGVRFVLAQVLLEKSENPTLKPGDKAVALAQARKLLRDVEQEENEFSDQAKRLKIGVMAKQGAFTKKVADLKSFEDCYMRAQYESIQMGEETSKLTDPEAQEKVRKPRIDTILAVLELGLKQPEAQRDAKVKAPPEEVATARQLITQYHFYTKKYDAAIKSGEGFARADPRSGHAAVAAACALQSYAQLIADREAPLDGTDDLKDENGQKVSDKVYLDRLAQQRQKMADFAGYCLERWPREVAGDLARHQLAMSLTRKRRVRDEPVKEEDRVKNLQEAIKLLSGVTPAYPAHLFAMRMLAEKALQAEAEKVSPPPEGQSAPVSYRQRAITALQSIPDMTSDDSAVNQNYLLAKAQLAEELYKDKKYAEMDQVIKSALDKVPTIVLSDELKTDEQKTRDKEKRDYIRNRLTAASLYSRYGLADIEFKAGRHDKVLAVLNPLVDQVKDDKLPQIKNDPQLGNALLSMALRSCIQSGQVERTRAAVAAYQKMSGEEATGVPPVLRLLAGLIDRQISDLKEKKDDAGLKKTIEGFNGILDDLKKQTKPSPQFILTLALCYSNMGKHAEAADLLKTVPEPKPEAGAREPDAEALKNYRACSLLHVRQLRLSKKFPEARVEIDKMLGTKDKKGWGFSDIAVRKESLLLLVDDRKYVEGYQTAQDLVKALVKRAETDNAMKEHYLEIYFLMVECLVEYGKGKEAMKKQKAFQDASTLIDQLEKKFTGFGNEATKKRFQDLLNANPELKKEHEKLRPAK